MTILQPLHPALVHLPIVLALAALILDLAARHPRGRALEPGAAALIVLAAASAVAAVLSGEQAGRRAVVPAAARGVLERHEELGELAMWALLAVALLRVALGSQARFRGAPAWVSVLLLAAVVALLIYNGHLGGQLVFRHGVGTDLLLPGGGPLAR